MILTALAVGLISLAAATLLLATAYVIAGRGSDAYWLPYLGCIALTCFGVWIVYVELTVPGEHLPRLQVW